MKDNKATGNEMKEELKNNSGEDLEKPLKYYVFKFGYTVLIATLIGGGYFFRHNISGFLEGNDEHLNMAKGAQTVGPAEVGKKEKKIKYWASPMDPTYIRDEPGKSPMGMDLVPVYEEEGDDGNSVRISPATEQNIGVRTAKVVTREITRKIRAVGNVTYDERIVADVQSKTSGWVEKLYVDFTGQEVKKGDFLLEIYSPELVSTQEEFLLAISYRNKMAKSNMRKVVEGGDNLLESSRRRLELFDVPKHQIEEIEKTGKIKKALHIHSPVNGVVVKKNVVVGMQVTPGMSMYTVADLSRVWVLADIYEYETPWVKLGQTATMTLAAIPGKKYSGTITYIDPFMKKKTRTLRIRIEFENPGLMIKPDMYAEVEIMSRVRRKGLAVPTEAVIRSGSRNVVIVSKGEGKFEPRDVQLGIEGDGYHEILAGLNDGDIVVTSANFMLDSESNLKEAINKMLDRKAKQTEPESMPMDHSSMKDMDHSSMKDMDHSGMKDMDHSSMKDMDHSGMKDMDHSGMKDMDHSGMKDMDHSSMKDMDHSSMKDMDHSSMKDMDHSGMKDMDPSDSTGGN